MEALGICIVLCMRVKQPYEYIILYVKDLLCREAGNAQAFIMSTTVNVSLYCKVNMQLRSQIPPLSTS